MSQPQRLCWNCDAVVPGKVQFCPNCSSLQKEMGAEMLAEPRTHGSVGMGGFFVVIAVFILLAGGIGWYFLQGRGPAKELLPEGKAAFEKQKARSEDSPNEITPEQREVLPSGRDS